MTGRKHDGDKPDMSLLWPDFLEAVSHVLAGGERDYGYLNWQRLAISRIIAAGMRHLNAINNGEDFDGKTGMPHAAHLGANAMFLQWFARNSAHVKDDRRWRPSNSTKMGWCCEKGAASGVQMCPECAEWNEATRQAVYGFAPNKVTVDELQNEVTQWADKCLGTRDYDSALTKLVDEEIPELREAGVTGREDELADVFIIALDLASLAGVDIVKAVRNKLEINRRRTWTKRDNVFHHVPEPAEPEMFFGVDMGSEEGDVTEFLFVNKEALLEPIENNELSPVVVDGEVSRKPMYGIGTKVLVTELVDNDSMFSGIFTVVSADFNPVTGHYEYRCIHREDFGSSVLSRTIHITESRLIHVED